jgi:hypothetical protein
MKLFWIGGCVVGLALAVLGAVRGQSCPSCGGGIGPAGFFGKGWNSPLCIDNCAQIPRRAQPAPSGTYVNRWTFLQEQKAELDDFVFYQNMWYRGGTELGPMGRYYLDMVSNRLPRTPFPVVIETSRDDKLDEARREVIITLLERRGFKDPSRVIVAFPIAEGLQGQEAPRIATFYLLGGNAYGGGYGANGFGGFGGFGGATFGPLGR